MKLPQHHFSHATARRILLIGAAFAMSAVIILQALRLESLNSQISQLSSEVATQKAELSAIRCSSTTKRESNASLPFTIPSSGGERSYTVHTPAQYTYNARTPVVIVFTGKGGSGAGIAAATDFTNQPVLSVYPDPLRDSEGITAWQGAPYSPEGVSDVRFTADIIQQIGKEFCIDTQRVYTVGMSNGGGIAWLSACYLNDTIAATASVSGAYYKKYQKCPGATRPTPVLAVHSRTDRQVPYTGSTTRELSPIEEWTAQRAQSNHCNLTPKATVASTYSLSTWEDCKQSATVQLLSLRNESHGWPQLPDITPDPNIPEENLSGFVWDFLRHHRLNQ